ncbi:MAG: TOBE domain-containing protein [Chloroflexi bacterium]|nr:TOBE domain-containing protein [Chloroflexota bacterium]
MLIVEALPARIEAIDGETTQVVVGQTRLTATAAPDFAAQQSALLFIRPNDVTIIENGADAQRNILSGTVQQATYLGETMDYRMQVSEEMELRVQASGARRYAVGERMRLHLPAERLRLIAEE